MHPFLRVHNGKFSSLDAFLNSKWLAASTPPRLGCSSWASASLLVCLRLGAEVAGRSGQTSLRGGGGLSVPREQTSIPDRGEVGGASFPTGGCAREAGLPGGLFPTCLRSSQPCPGGGAFGMAGGGRP